MRFGKFVFVPIVISSFIIGFILCLFLQKYIAGSVAFSGVVISSREENSPDVRLSGLCSGIAAEENYVPALLGMSDFLRDKDSVSVASEKFIERAVAAIRSGDQDPYRSMSTGDREREISRIVGDK